MSGKVTHLEAATIRVSSRSSWMFLQLGTDDGLTGLGEFSDGGPIDELRHALIGAREMVQGTDLPGGQGALASRMAKWRDQSSSTAQLRARATVLSSVDQALSDIAATAAGLPLWKWLDGAVEIAPSVPLYANLNRVIDNPSPEVGADIAIRAVADGFRAVKCAPFDQEAIDGISLVESGLRRVAAIRDAIGPDIPLMIDAHCHIPAGQVHNTAMSLERFAPSWLEDAVPFDDVPALKALARATAIPLAGGEDTFRVADIVDVLASDVMAVVMPDVKHAGGVTGTRAISALAGNVKVSFHNPTGPVATAASLHLAAVCPNFHILEIAYGDLDFANWPIGEFSAGALRPPSHQGLGIGAACPDVAFRPVDANWWCVEQ